MIDKIIDTVNELFIKQPNTIYEIRIVYDNYRDNINIFFEHYKIGRATISRQIARLEGSEKGHMADFAQQITQATQLRVELVGFD
ncbi:hypothetical protein [Leuconostoc lactis]|uniref:hypothetical protein n=1 Tax=Leuconostoc lactis TaxID=1246 RepID=UPI001021F2C2|nr:hypothetical protein [Leuconostoc lactis]MSB65627.1 hypothetical protein [Leuconostoc lactis]RYS84997.1 hypothetical protein EAI73_08155 [Leuconostoc lactis]